MSVSPILASSLLRIEHERQNMPPHARTWTTGIKDVDTGIGSVVWTGLKVIGVASEKGSLLGEHIIAEHLLCCQDNIVQDHGYANGFIVAPHNSSVVTSIHSRLVERQSHPPVTTTQPTAVKCLERVQVLQYFDFAGLTESVAEVSAHLFDMNAPLASQKAVLYIEGLGTMIEDTQRRIGPVQANALLSSLLRTLVLLSRTYPYLLIMLDLRLKKQPNEDDAPQSAFASGTGSDTRIQPGGVLGRTLESALDVLVLVHDAYGVVTRGSWIVEVVKDRVGDALGEWAIWKYR